MKKKNKGSLTIEASIALTSFMFLVLFILGFGRFNLAQGLVSHATIQSAQAIAVDSYFRETIAGTGTYKSLQTFEKLSSILFSETDVFTSFADSERKINKEAREQFIKAIAENEEEANDILISLGVKDGINGMNFKKSTMINGDVIVYVEYTLELQFSFFKSDAEIKLSKAAKSKAFK